MPVAYVPAPEGPGYRWGASGKVYRVSRYGREGARRRALAQGRAVLASDAKPWELEEPGAPSPDAYEAIASGWLVAWRADLARALAAHQMPPIPDGLTDEQRRIAEAERRQAAQRAAASIQGMTRPPQSPPSPAQVGAVGVVGARVAGHAAARGIVRAGASAAAVERRVGMLPPPPPGGSAPPPAPPSGGGPTVSAGIQGIDIAPTAAEQAVLEGWAREGVDLITALEPETTAKLDALVAEAARGGMRVEALTEAVMEATGASERHARLIARDQTAKLSARVTQQMQRLAGITHYRWRTVRDSRVRTRHAQLEGTVWAIDGEGAPGAGPYGQPAHPGQGIQCRCYQEPIIPEDLR